MPMFGQGTNGNTRPVNDSKALFWKSEAVDNGEALSFSRHSKSPVAKLAAQSECRFQVKIRTGGCLRPIHAVFFTFFMAPLTKR
jgi:hypothetical protein